MSKDFRAFALAVKAQFDRMSQHELFVTDLTGDDTWQAYLAAFPPFTNPIFRKRTEHDGSYDRNVIRQIGNLIAFDGDKALTIWDIQVGAPYNEVCAVMAAKVKQGKLSGIFRTRERKFGHVSTVETLETGGTHRWYHFHAEVAAKHLVTRDLPTAVTGEFLDKLGVYRRGLEELTLDALDSVTDLIASSGLYRGDENKSNLAKFRKLFLGYKALTSDTDKNRYLFKTFSDEHRAVTTIRNTAFGTLLIDLSEGESLETAVTKYEHKVSAGSYRRTSAIVTPRMIADAQKTIDELGLESALDRRFAVLSDVSVNNVQWVNNDVKSKMKGGLAGKIGLLPTQPDKVTGKAEEVGIGEFMSNILPTVTAMDLLLTNKHTGNLVSLTAPVHADAGRLFKWDNGFAWSYNGNITDSIKERVKAAGGNVDAKLRISLAWFNTDDLDLHAMQSPEGHVWYRAKHGETYSRGNNGQILDVDMNAPHTTLTRTPVENLSWRNPQDGAYQIAVHQFNVRDRSDVGFQLQFSFNGDVQQFSRAAAVRQDETVHALRFMIRDGKLIDFQVGEGFVGGAMSQDVWGLKTESFVKVNTVLFSPNHWDDNNSGNLHYLFMLDGCVNPEPTRGIYNEFLLPELDKHRKVFELLGDKTKCEPTPDQLSGVGFSSTKRESVTVRVATSTRGSKLYTINF